jgi:hypothetical protein
MEEKEDEAGDGAGDGAGKSRNVGLLHMNN